MSDETDTNTNNANESKPLGELRDLFKQLTQPVIDGIDSRLRTQVDARVDERVDEVLADRLAILERAVADLDRAVKALASRIDEQD